MKRSLSCFVFSLLLVSCGGGDDGAGPDNGSGNTNTDPTPTTPGTPTGTATTQSVGAGGGTVTSADGLFSVTIPPGALPASTAASAASGEIEITIQPIANTAWGGIGSGYRLLPDGLSFAVPVELNFALEDSMLWGSDTLFVDTARQDDEGVWGILKNRRINWETRTLTCTTSHFSDYSMVEGLQIRPRAASIGPLATVTLHVDYCVQQPVTGDPDLVALIYTCDSDLAPVGTFSNWSVNGVTGGNGTVGTVVKVAPSGASARYTAPSAAPQQNPVAVSVMAQGRRGSTLLVSNITIGGLWWGTITMTAGNASSVANVVWQQTGAFQGLESYRPLSGTVHYEPDTDYGPVCDFVSMSVKDIEIYPAFGAFFIDWNKTPAQAYGYGTTDPDLDLTEICYTCDGWSEPDCRMEQLPGWFAADSLAVSPNGDSIDFTYTDNGASPPKSITLHFEKGLPPVLFSRKR